MQLLRLNLVNFQLKELLFEPVAGLNILCGSNAQGKATTEAIFLARPNLFALTVIGLAHRGGPALAVGGQVQSASGEFSLAVQWTERGQKFHFKPATARPPGRLLEHLTAVALLRKT